MQNIPLCRGPKVSIKQTFEQADNRFEKTGDLQRILRLWDSVYFQYGFITEGVWQYPILRNDRF
jgi:hypothetical protein